MTSVSTRQRAADRNCVFLWESQSHWICYVAGTLFVNKHVSVLDFKSTYLCSKYLYKSLAKPSMMPSISIQVPAVSAVQGADQQATQEAAPGMQPVSKSGSLDGSSAAQDKAGMPPSCQKHKNSSKGHRWKSKRAWGEVDCSLRYVNSKNNPVHSAAQ